MSDEIKTVKVKLRKNKAQNILSQLDDYLDDPDDEHGLIIKTKEGIFYKLKLEQVGREFSNEWSN